MKFNFNLDDIRYVKILYTSGHSGPTTVKAAIKNITEDEITACAEYEEDFIVKTPQEVTLSIVCNDGLYRTKTKLKSVESEAPYIFFCLEIPVGMEYQQNREYFRISANYGCAYYVSIDGESRNYTTTTCDISANGVSLELPEPIYTDGDSEIDIMVEEKLIHAKIKYIRNEKSYKGYKLSFSFSEISQADQDYISKVCIQKQLEQKRNKTL